MNKQDVIKKVYESIKVYDQMREQRTGIDVSKISLNSDLMKDLGLDSLDVVELITVTENEFNLSVDPYKTDYPDICTVGDLVNYIFDTVSDTSVKIVRTSHDLFLAKGGKAVDVKSIMTPRSQQILEEEHVFITSGMDGGIAFREYGSRFNLSPMDSERLLCLLVSEANSR